MATVTIDPETVALVQEQYNFETEAEAERFLRARMKRLLDRAADNDFQERFSDTDVLALETLVTQRAIDSEIADRFVYALSRWSKQRQALRKSLPFEAFTAHLSTLLYELQDKQAFLRWANRTLFRQIKGEPNSREHAEQLGKLFERVVPVATGGADHESFIDPRVHTAVQTIIRREDRYPQLSKRVRNRVLLMLEALSQIHNAL